MIDNDFGPTANQDSSRRSSAELRGLIKFCPSDHLQIRRQSMPRSTSFAMLFLCAFPSLAARPFDTDDAPTIAVAATELEFGNQFDASTGRFGVGLKHGLTTRLDIGLAMGHSTWPDTLRAWEGVCLGFKLNLVADMLSVSFTNEFGTGVYSVNGIASWQIDAAGMDLNLGGEFASGERKGTLTWGIHPRYDVGPCTVGAEMTGTDKELSLWRFGAQFHATPRLGLDAGIGSSLEGEADWITSLGVWVAITPP